MKKLKKVLVSGSLVFDTLFDLTSPIKDQIVIVDGKASKQNLMFGANDKEVYFGGTAGNIAYGIGLLGAKSLVLSVVGKDFDGYAKHLKHGGSESRIYVDDKRFTATFYGMSDPCREQIGIFQGNAYHKHIDNLTLTRLLKTSDWKDIAIGIFAAGTAKSIAKQLKEFKKNAPKDALTIFDPGQMLMIDFTESLVTEALKNADLLILNDTEFLHLQNKFGFTKDKIFALGVKYIIETKGADGSILYEKEKQTLIKALKVKRVVDPTGAGDAFRAGLVCGLLSGQDFNESMRLGSRLGALCVQSNGGQTYRL